MSPPQHPPIPRPETQRIDKLQTMAHVNKDEGIGGPTGSCVAVPAFRQQRSDGRVSVRIETVAPTARDSSAYLHAVDVATKAIELRDAKPPKPQFPPGRIIRG